MNALIIYFSATGTTRKIVKAFAKGLDCEVTFCDITKPHRRADGVLVEHDLVVIAVPIYGERIPGFVYDYLKQIDGSGRPLVGISVYGNMGYGISLEQFESYSRENNFSLMGAGMFIGEHTYANKNTPVAFARPDETDLLKAASFGKKVRDKFDAGQLNTITVPKSKMPKFVTKFPDSGTRVLIKQPIINEELCNNCKACALKCPVGAINSDTLLIDEKKCIRCFACVKGCPKSARRAEFRISLLGNIFKSLGHKRKENQIII